MHRRILTSIILITLTSSVLAFSARAPETEPSASAATEAAEALEAGDLRLLGLGLRVITLPGLTPDEQKLAAPCGVRLLEADDVVRSVGEQQELSALIEYANAYNRYMIGYCLEGIE